MADTARVPDTLTTHCGPLDDTLFQTAGVLIKLYVTGILSSVHDIGTVLEKMYRCTNKSALSLEQERSKNTY